jgi:hypothetical protein
MRYLLPVVFALALIGCTQEQDKKAGDTLTTVGKTAETIREVIKTVPNPLGGPLDLALGGLATLATAAGAYFTKKAVSRGRKNKVLRQNMTKEQRLAADKRIFGKAFDPKLSK